MKTFDLNIKHNFSNNLQENLKQLYKDYGKKFKLQYNKNIIEVTMKYNTHKLSKIKYYSITYDIPNRDFDLYPLHISFIDVLDKKVNNNCYINYIHKTDNISGSEMIKLAMAFCKIVKVHTAYIYDSTTVTCKNTSGGSNIYDLSYLKLLENNNTFYMKFGFDFMVSTNDFFAKYFITKESKKKYIIDLINKCKKIKNSDVCKIYTELLEKCTETVIKQTYDDVSIINNDILRDMSWKDTTNIISLIVEATEILNLLSDKKGYLYETMIELFKDNDKCQNYDIILKYIIDNNPRIIKFKNKKIDMTIFDCFKLLKELRYSYFYITF
jgi:hypothetical protein